MKTSTRCFVGILFCLLAAGTVRGEDGNYILLIESVNTGNLWTENFAAELRMELNRNAVFRLETYGLSAPFLKSVDEISPLRDEMKERYPVPPAAVVIVGDPGWLIAAPLFDEEWKDVPVIICHARRRIPASLQVLVDKAPLTEENSIPIEEFNRPYNATVLEYPVFLEENIRLMRQLQPEMRRLAFISDDRYISQCMRDDLQFVMRKYYPDIELALLTESEMETEQLMDTLSTYGVTTGILFYSWMKTAEEQQSSYVDRHFYRNLFVSTLSPVYAAHDFGTTQTGFAGGYYISVKEFTASCIALIDRVVAGERASSIPSGPGGTPHAYLHYPILQWYDISPERYPDDAIYYDRPSGFFERHLRTIVILAAVLLVVLLGWWGFRLRSKDRNLLNKFLLKMLDSPVYLMDRTGKVLKELNSLHRTYNVLSRDLTGNYAFGELFVEKNEFLRYVRLINFVVWTGKVREKVIRLREGKNEVRYLFTRIVKCDEERVLVMISDVSGKEKVRREREEYRFFLKTTLENLPIPVFVKDRGNKGRFTEWNKGMADTLGIPASSVRGFASEALPAVVRQVTDVEDDMNGLPDGDAACRLCRIVDKEGRKKMLAVHYSLVSYREQSWVVGSVIDLTEREERKVELERLNRRYELVLRAMGTMPWTWDLRTDTLECDGTYVSSKYHIVRGIVHKTKEEHYLQMVPEHREPFRRMLQQLCDGTISLMNQEYQVYYRGYDRPLWLETFVVVGERDKAGRPLELVGASTIVDERKQMEADLRLSKEKAEEANKIKSAFLANMTHEIRTPLNAITGFASLLVATNDTPENREYVQIIDNNSAVLLKLVNDVLDMSKIESGMLELVYAQVNVNGVLTDLVASWRMRMPEGVEIRFEPGLESCQLSTDEVRLMQVMGNYVSNAVKYTEKGSITVGYYPPKDGFLRFFVRDTGIGIPADKAPVVFDRFVKLDYFKQGTGLGLSICKLIAECIHGRVGVDSEPGKGSEFWFDHPYTPVSLNQEEQE